MAHGEREILVLRYELTTGILMGTEQCLWPKPWSWRQKKCT